MRPPQPSSRPAKTVSLTIVNQRLVTNYLDTRGAVAEYDAARDRVTLTLGSQGSHDIRDTLAADVLRIDPKKLHVVTPDVGGGFGTKLFTYREYALVVLAAQKLKRPVRWIAERTEHFLGDAQGRDNITTARLALDGKGRFLALDIDIVADMGAYLSAYAPYIPYLGAGMSPGVYDIPACFVRLRGVYTHTVPVDAYRGAGRPEASYVIERLVDAAARELDIAPDALAAEEFHPAEGDAVCDRDRQGLRLRRLRRPHGARAGTRRLGRLQEARRRGQAAGPHPRHRAFHLHRSLRHDGTGHRDDHARSATAA